MENLDKELVELGKEMSSIKSGIKKLHTEITNKQDQAIELVSFKKTDDISDIAKGLLEFHTKIKSIEKTEINPFFKNSYSDINSVISTIRPILAECKLFLMQMPIQADKGGMSIKTIIMSESGQYIESDTVSIIPPKMEAQQYAACATYFKRMSLSAMLGLTYGEPDDDGSSVSPQNTGQTKSKPTSGATRTTRAGRI